MSSTEAPAPPAVEESASNNYLRAWQNLTIALMLTGYAGYYLCRSNLSVATPLIIKEFGAQGVDKDFIGGIASVGTLVYAFGKFVSGSLTDLLGGRRMFLLGMGGAIFCTVLFALGGLPLFTLAWALNRGVQSAGWVGMVRITSRWFSYSRYGAVMGVISLSFLFGDFLSRLFLGQLITWGLGWRALFYASAGTLGVLFLANLFLLKESPRDVGEEEPAANPANLFGEEGLKDQSDEAAGSLRSTLLPLFGSGLFWVVCILSLGFTLVRETFNTWTPQYLTEVVKMDPGPAGQASSFFPLAGGISVLLAGRLSDRLGRTGRAALIFLGLVLSIPALLALGYVNLQGSSLLAILALGAVAFVMIGPYSFLGGAIALDFGGKRASATACGWIDGVGYLGGVFAGKYIGGIAKDFGWSRAFLALAVVAAVSSVTAALYWKQQAARR